MPLRASRRLRAAIGWSFDLLEPEQRQLCAALGVFVGGWRLEEAEAVCGPATLEGPRRPWRTTAS